jgi:hypothetical protein
MSEKVICRLIAIYILIGIITYGHAVNRVKQECLVTKEKDCSPRLEAFFQSGYFWPYYWSEEAWKPALKEQTQ